MTCHCLCDIPEVDEFVARKRDLSCNPFKYTLKQNLSKFLTCKNELDFSLNKEVLCVIIENL